MSEELKAAYLKIAESLEVAVRELELKASILKKIMGTLYHQASNSSNPDLMHHPTPEELFDTIKKAMKEYQEYK